MSTAGEEMTIIFFKNTSVLIPNSFFKWCVSANLSQGEDYKVALCTVQIPFIFFNVIESGNMTNGRSYSLLQKIVFAIK